MGISQADYINMQARVAKQGPPAPAAPSQAEAREMKLHDKIIALCHRQWPRWKYIRARPDEPSTIAEGAQDFTIFMPNGRTLCLECKSKTGKLSDKQRIWAKEMEMLGHTVYEVKSMDDVESILRDLDIKWQ